MIQPDSDEPVTRDGLLEVARVLLGVDDHDPMLEPGLLVLAAGMVCGARNRHLQRWTGLPARTVNTVSYWLRASGIWRGTDVYAPWLDESESDEHRMIAFIMHTMTAVGDIRSTDGGETFMLRQPGQAIDPDAEPPGWTDAIRSENACYRLLEEARWPAGRPDRCPHCGSVRRFYFLAPRNLTGRLTHTGRPTARRIWKCAACRRQFSVLSGTALQRSKIPLRILLGALAEQGTVPGSVTQATLVRRYRLRPGTANHLLELTGRAASSAEPLAALMAPPAKCDSKVATEPLSTAQPRSDTDHRP